MSRKVFQRFEKFKLGAQWTFSSKNYEISSTSSQDRIPDIMTIFRGIFTFHGFLLGRPISGISRPKTRFFLGIGRRDESRPLIKIPQK